MWGVLCAAPDDDSTIVLLAKTQLRLGSAPAYDSAIRLLKRATSLRPDLPEYHCLLGVGLMQVGAGQLVSLGPS